VSKIAESRYKKPNRLALEHAGTLAMTRNAGEGEATLTRTRVQMQGRQMRTTAKP
jgi:hypothetical protein